MCEQGLYPKIRDRHLPGRISAGILQSQVPELLQLLNSEFCECGFSVPCDNQPPRDTRMEYSHLCTVVI